MRRLKDMDTAIQFTDGFLVHYNFFRPHESLRGNIPAEEADIRFPYQNWAQIIRRPVSKEGEIKSHSIPRVSITKAKIRLPRPPKRTRKEPINQIIVSKPVDSDDVLLSRRRVKGTRVVKRLRASVI